MVGGSKKSEEERNRAQRVSCVNWELTVGLTSFFTETRGHVALEFTQRRWFQCLKIDFDLVRIRVTQRWLTALDDVHYASQFIT